MYRNDLSNEKNGRNLKVQNTLNNSNIMNGVYETENVNITLTPGQIA